MYKIVDPNYLGTPSQEALDTLQPKNVVKVCFKEDGNFERLWLTITKIEGRKFTAIVDNIPTSIKSLKADDLVTFRRCDIIDIYDRSKQECKTRIIQP